MNKYSHDILRQFKIYKDRLHYITGPLSGKPAGHQRPNGIIYVRFNGQEYKHDELLFLYKQQLESKHLAKIDTSKSHNYRTVSGLPVHFYTLDTYYNAPPYVIHGAVKDNKEMWHLAQWTVKGECIVPHLNLEQVK